jgi:hypothetical protein
MRDLSHHFLNLLVEEFYATRYQGGSISLINVGSGIHCLRNYCVSTS